MVLGIPFKTGILISTDKCKDGFNTVNGYYMLASNYLFNKAEFCIKLIPHQSSIAFNYFFGSEEYPDYISYSNDYMQINVNGPGINGNKNIAVLPNNTGISVFNINHNNNLSYYTYNTNPSPYTYNGFTIPLQASIHSLIPDSVYQFCFIVSDDYYADPGYDSGAFIEVLQGNEMILGNQNNQSSSGLKVYPNPTIDFFHINFPLELIGKSINIKINSLQGKTVYEDYILIESIDYAINCTNWSAGTYFMNIYSENFRIIKKIVVLE